MHRRTTKLERVCAGSSMTPTVQPGDPVDVIACASVRPKAGDAVLFSGATGDYDILHRFVFKLPFLPLFVHRGDAIGARVGLARSERILGIARLARRKPSLRDRLDGWILVARRATRRLTRGTRVLGRSARD
jgi:hypothetical protein